MLQTNTGQHSDGLLAGGARYISGAKSGLVFLDLCLCPDPRCCRQVWNKGWHPSFKYSFEQEKKEWDDVSSVLQYLACNSLKGRGCPEASTVLGSSSELRSPESQVFQVVMSSPSVWKSKKAETGTRVQVSTTARPSPTTCCAQEMTAMLPRDWRSVAGSFLNQVHNFHGKELIQLHLHTAGSALMMCIVHSWHQPVLQSQSRGYLKWAQPLTITSSTFFNTVLLSSRGKRQS